MNALLVDDERLAREELRRLLRPHSDITIVGEAAHADEAQARLAELPVDLLFLDVKMPGANGFDLLERLDRVPRVIFTTAYDQYAVRAFEVSALDYLLKPIRAERLAAALDKVREASARLPVPPASAKPHRLRASDRVFLRDGDRCWMVTLADIAFFEAEGNYAQVHFGQNRALIRSSLNTLEARLDPAAFFRASRQHLINLRFVSGVEPDGDDGYRVRVGERFLTVSRRQSRKLRDTLGL